MNELQPCPFCGGHDLGDELFILDDTDDYFIFCGKCKSSGSMQKTQEEAIEAWNKRVTPC